MCTAKRAVVPDAMKSDAQIRQEQAEGQADKWVFVLFYMLWYTTLPVRNRNLSLLSEGPCADHPVPCHTSPAKGGWATTSTLTLVTPVSATTPTLTARPRPVDCQVPAPDRTTTVRLPPRSTATSRRVSRLTATKSESVRISRSNPPARCTSLA